MDIHDHEYPCKSMANPWVSMHDPEEETGQGMMGLHFRYIARFFLICFSDLGKVFGQLG